MNTPTRRYITHDGVTVGWYDLTPMPGCSKAVAISHGLAIYPEYRGKGIGTKAHQERLDIAKQLGYQVLICTTKSTNDPECRILRKFHWKLCRTFSNPHSGNDVCFWFKHLTDPYLDISDVGV